MTPVQVVLEKPVRKRKAHTKSRRGCKNCKIRGVKCDETKLCCKRCKAYGTTCNFNATGQDLDMVFQGTNTMITDHFKHQISTITKSNSKIQPPVYPFLCPAVYVEDASLRYQLNSEELDRLGRFSTRTVLAIGSNTAARYFQHIIIDLACSHPCLMHIIQIITSIHDRYLSGPRTASNASLTIPERHHLGKAAKLFNDELSKPILPNRRDGLWATAALFGSVSWATIEASTPEEAWPLTSPDPSDLMWIKMSENKLAIWEITQPTRIDSIWFGLAEEYKRGFGGYKTLEPGIDGIPPDFVKLYGLTELSTPENDPYHSAVRTLTNLLPKECTRDDVGPFIAFIAHFTLAFKALLQDRDAKGMLIMSYWYMKVANTLWSLDWRSKLECQAICIYLERYHWLDKDLMRMVQVPKRWCGANSPYQNTLLLWSGV